MKFDEVSFRAAFRAYAKGGVLTRLRADTTWRNLGAFAKAKKMVITPKGITDRQLRRYVEYRVAAGANARTVQNEVSHIRRAMRGVGRGDALGDLRNPANPWSSKRLGVPSGTRIGACVKADAGLVAGVVRSDVRAAFGLQVALGLRLREAVMSAGSLKGWALELSRCSAEGRNGAWLEVSSGTKGGRPRSVWVPAERFDEVRVAVLDAAASVSGGRLVASESLASAVRVCSAAAKAAGFQSHGLRKAWAVQQLRMYEGRGLERAEALRRLSNDLGHGDGRGRWVLNNYVGAGRG